MSRLLPIQMSARQVGNSIQPIGEAFGLWEEKQVREIMQKGAEKDTRKMERQEEMEERIAALSRLALLPPHPGKSRSIPEIEADSFRMNKERMRYLSFRAQG